MSRAAIPGDLKTILASHALIHSAEGELFRGALLEASQSCGVRVRTTTEREVWNEAAVALGVGPDSLQRELTVLGKRLGPPWTLDQKVAAAALLVMAGPKPRSRAAGRAGAAGTSARD